MHTFIAQLIRAHHLDAAHARQLWRLSGLHQPPQQLGPQLERALALTAAMLLGAGLVFFVAANWQAQSRSVKLALLQGAVIAPVLAAWLWPRARTALLWLATLALGALLAFVGQTYQTGADAWQLFALWALLALPWALLARTDWLWAGWILIVGVALASWAGLPFDFGVLQLRDLHSPGMIMVRALLWGALFLWPVLARRLGLVQPTRVHVSWPTAALLALAVWVSEGLWALFSHGGGPSYGVNLLLVAGAFLMAWRTTPRDHVVLALALTSANAMVLGLLAYSLFDSVGGDWLARLLLFTLITAAAVGGSGTWLYRLQRNEARA